MIMLCKSISCHLILSHLSGRRGTGDEVATVPFYLSLSSAAFRESPNPIPVHSLMLSSHLPNPKPLCKQKIQYFMRMSGCCTIISFANKSGNCCILKRLYSRTSLTCECPLNVAGGRIIPLKFEQ